MHCAILRLTHVISHPRVSLVRRTLFINVIVRDLFLAAKGEQSYRCDSPCEVMWDFLPTVYFLI